MSSTGELDPRAPPHDRSSQTNLSYCCSWLTGSSSGGTTTSGTRLCPNTPRRRSTTSVIVGWGSFALASWRSIDRGLRTTGNCRIEDQVLDFFQIAGRNF
nr:hypothetical protein Iba_chr02bCG11080 [Ipomoea batatas]